MVAIAYYISSHGYGHAARQGAVVKALGARGVDVYVRTGAPEKFFPTATGYHGQAYDSGMVQSDGLTFDIPATLATLHAFAEQEAQLVQQEVTFLRETGCQLVVSDMPPLACEIAHQAGIPSVVVSHFLWDWVYGHYVADYPAFAPHIERMQSQYRKATLALQMQIPLPHPFPLFAHVEPVGAVYNAISKTRDDMRTEFSIPDDKAMVLLSMGGHQWGDSNLDALNDVRDAVFLVVPSAWEQVKHTPERFRVVPMDYPHYHNLIAAADMMVGKAGGSTVAEVIGHRTPMIYTLAMDTWRESALLKQTMEQFASAQFVTQEAFTAGEWVAHLPDMLGRAHTWETVNREGVDEVVGYLLGMLR
ncbi:MAG: hypothetical protein AAFR81_08760 [Chloroflexota bacterium]